MDNIAIGINFILFLLVIIIFAKEKDYVAYSLLLSFIACLYTTIHFRIPISQYKDFLDFSPLIFIICSQIMIMIVDEKKLFQYIAIKALHWTKARPRPFLYAIAFISSIIAAITPDVMVSLVFIPLVIRVAKVLKIDPKPFMYAITINMNIGACLAPLNPTNFLIAVAFNKSPIWFFQTMIGMYIFNVLLTTFLLDMIFLKKEPIPDEIKRKTVLELMQPTELFDKKKDWQIFWINCGVFLTIIFCFFVLPHMELVSLIGAIILSLINRKNMEKSLEKVDWKIIFFLISMFLMIDTMEIAGTFELIGSFVSGSITSNPLVVAIIIVLIASFFSALLDNTPVVLMIIPIVLNLFVLYPDLLEYSTPIIFGLIAAVNLGGNLLPQGAAGDLMTLSLAKKNGIDSFNYRSLTKIGGSFALIHIIITILFICVMIWII